jgi:hypothetical protein
MILLGLFNPRRDHHYLPSRRFSQSKSMPELSQKPRTLLLDRSIVKMNKGSVHPFGALPRPALSTWPPPFLDRLQLFLGPLHCQRARRPRRVDPHVEPSAIEKFVIQPELRLDAIVTVIAQSAEEAIMAAQELEALTA